MKNRAKFSRREKEMMDIIYMRGHATAAEVLEEMADPPSYSAVRATLRILEEKGHLRHEEEGNRYSYYPTVGIKKASRSALDDLVTTFFDGSAEQVVAALIETRRDDLTDRDFDRLSALIEEARGEGR